MNNQNMRVNFIDTDYENGKHEYTILRSPIKVNNGNCKKNKKTNLDFLHNLMKDFKIVNEISGEIEFLEIDEWILYQIKSLHNLCSDLLSNEKIEEIINIKNVLEKIQFLFNEMNCKNKSLDDLELLDQAYIKTLLEFLPIELEDWKIDKTSYRHVIEKVDYILTLINNREDVKDLEKKRRDSLSRARVSIKDYIYGNKWDIYLTITFDKNKINRFDMRTLLDKVQGWFTNIKRTKCHNLKYLLLPDLHLGERGNSSAHIDNNEYYAGHFHCLIANMKEIEIVEKIIKAGNGTVKNIYDKHGRKVYSIPALEKKFGYTYLTYCSKNVDGLICYFQKHINLKNEFKRTLKKRYYCSQKLQKGKKTFSYKTFEERKKLIKSIYNDKGKKVHRKEIKISNRLVKQKITKYLITDKCKLII